MKNNNNNAEEISQIEEGNIIYPSQRPADAPLPGRPRRRGHNNTTSTASSSTRSTKKKKRKKKKNTSSLFGILVHTILTSKDWIFPSSTNAIVSQPSIHIGIATICWYVLGVVSITTSKMLLSTTSNTPNTLNKDMDDHHYNNTNISLKPTWLTFQQLCIGAFLLHTTLKYNLLNVTFPKSNNRTANAKHSTPTLSSTSVFFLSSLPSSTTSSPASSQLFYVALFFSLGFFMTNVSFYATVPSLVETIKAAEPITSAVIATMWNLERLGNAEAVSLITIVFGVLLSTLSTTSASTTHTITITSFLCVLASNVCFSFRGLHQKLLQQTTSHGSTDDMNDVVLQYRMQCIGYMLLLIPAFFMDGLDLVRSIIRVIQHNENGWFLFGRFLCLSFCNGFAFASYNLASTYILTRISVIHHATLNCLRRVFAIIITSFLFQVQMTWCSWLGIIISIMGFMSFTHYKMERKKFPKPLSTLLPMSAV